MDNRSGWQILCDARFLLRKGLKFGDPQQIRAHRFWEAVEVLKDRIRKGAKPAEYRDVPGQVIDAAQTDLKDGVRKK